MWTQHSERLWLQVQASLPVVHFIPTAMSPAFWQYWVLVRGSVCTSCPGQQLNALPVSWAPAVKHWVLHRPLASHTLPRQQSLSWVQVWVVSPLVMQVLVAEHSPRDDGAPPDCAPALQVAPMQHLLWDEHAEVLLLMHVPVWHSVAAPGPSLRQVESVQQSVWLPHPPPDATHALLTQMPWAELRVGSAEWWHAVFTQQSDCEAQDPSAAGGQVPVLQMLCDMSIALFL